MPFPGQAWLRSWPVLGGVLPVRRSQVTGDLLAGVTLAALGIPEVLGYAKIAGMPIVTGLYTLLLPMAVFAVLGCSRHLVVGADSATAAILAASLIGLAAPGSARYVQLAGLAALLTGGLLLLARAARLGFLANFLSRTVLLGFLAGVGIQVAVSQLPDMLGLRHQGTRTIGILVHTVTEDPGSPGDRGGVCGSDRDHAGRSPDHPPGPGALIAVIGAIIVSRFADLAGRGVATVGAVPRGLPNWACPIPACTTPGCCWVPRPRCSSSSWPRAGDLARLRGEIPEGSARTSIWSAWAAPTSPRRSPDLRGQGQPEQDEMVDGAGGASQLGQPLTSAVVLVVLLIATDRWLTCRSPRWPRWSSSSPLSPLTFLDCGASSLSARANSPSPC